ncbi:MAG: Rieske (2Fe-2S) protein [Actinomycetes bacterium]
MSSQRPVDRRTVLGGVAVAGLAVVAVPALASCSSGSSAGGGSTTTKVKTSDVPVGGGVIESTTGVVVVQPTAGEFKAYSVVCPHQGCAVDGIANGEITCPCHGSIFKVSDGSVVTGPATQGLTVLPAKVEGSEVVVTP